MNSDLKILKIKRAIEEYRTAYWEYRNPDFVRSWKYKPEIIHSHCDNGQYIIALYDTWINTQRPGRFTIGKTLVNEASALSSNVESALEQILKLTRNQFTDDELFNNIRA